LDVDGQQVLTSDDHKLGHVVGRHGDCTIVESGHVFKTRHAIPNAFLHEADGVLRATVGKEVFTSSPKIEDGTWDEEAVLAHYGLIGPTVVDPDPDGLESAETVGARAGVQPDPARRLGTLGGEQDPSVEEPAVFDRMPSGVNDPSGSTANYH
jgi:hypothetical protein